ncbi:uncharacterized protein Z520_06908 [Fonsecaea multimorphosa CBS 102226]|uniref:Uncharacterized protein n=1 Tax=Fonsecaea multimorphosa CBS 102226 TaxID=1442371 RepID=A0A0D2IKB3_9EURO|nr:uncharacterized protein Z520_06908 [Fonsecaea multimorphosa CBS 102226]KIX97456.1 hypothetical protein Z520_06908 [Fonsecaea multimorphosa CBS 102226]OAL23421.1 hypothetical protein AYO22_06471 [Fonsecaea multimorphosa]
MSHPPPERFLHGKVAIVTGAGAFGDGIGNGRAAALLLAQDGCSVVCVDLQHGLAQRTVEMIQAAAGTGAGVAVAADVTKEDDCRKVVALAVEKYGRLDILVNNVGITGPKGTATEVDLQAFYKAMEVNVGSMIMMAKYAIPEMRKNQGQCAGAIVNLASVAGLRGGHPAIFYPTSKGSVVNMTRAMATHHGKDRVRVNCVCPGMVYTPMMYGVKGGMSDAERKARASRSILRTEGSGWDVGAAVRFLASDCARWLTGVILPVDAGATAAVGLGIPALHDAFLGTTGAKL